MLQQRRWFGYVRSDKAAPGQRGAPWWNPGVAKNISSNTAQRSFGVSAPHTPRQFIFKLQRGRNRGVNARLDREIFRDGRGAVVRACDACMQDKDDARFEHQAP